MTPILPYLRSRLGLYHLELDVTPEQVAKILGRIGAVAFGSSCMPDGTLVEYYRVGGEGFRISWGMFPPVEGVEVRGSKRIVAEISRLAGECTG